MSSYTRSTTSITRRRSCRSPSLLTVRIVLITLALGTISSLVLAQPQSLHSDEDASENEIPQDICAPLRQAQDILITLQPPPNAHLDNKVGGKISPFGSKGWGEDMGWGHEGPLSNTLRLLPRFIQVLLNPTAFLARIPLPFLSSSSSSSTNSHSKKKGSKIGKARRERIEKMLGLLDDAEKNGCEEVWKERAHLRMFPPKGVKQDLPAAYAAYSRYLETSADPEAQFIIGFFHASGVGGVQQDQGKALLYYTFAAVQGYKPAQMALGYRHWAGVGVKEDCMLALDHYQSAANQAYNTFLDGPPGGRTLPLTPTRLSDRVGGIYGPHASWASTGSNALRPAIRASSAVARGETEKEILEYYQYHSDRDSHLYTVRLGRLFYLGSVYFSHSGVSAGAEGVGEIPQSYTKAREYFLKVARVLWPVDFESDGRVSPKRKMSKEQEDNVKDPAMVAAAFLGRMALRGEGQKPDYRRARLWYERAAELGDREAHNGLGIIHRDGLLVPADRQKASHFFQAAAGQDLAESQVNLGKLHLDRGEIPQAAQFFEVALRFGATFEAFHLLASIHATNARSAGNGGGMCGVAVAYYKLVAERGSWETGGDYIRNADKAWLRGEEDKAMVGWWIAAEMGYEAAQNNVAFLLEQGHTLGDDAGLQRNAGEKEAERKNALALWVRSAAQDNVDAMVKVGDIYYQESTSSSSASPLAYERAVAYYQTAADTQTSSMAYWNLGFMYESGKGVKRDWHLAKRNYDLASETSSEAYLPVMLSLCRLYLKSWWIELRTGGAIQGLSLFESELTDTIPQLSTWERIKSLYSSPYPIDAEGDNVLDLEDEGWEDVSANGGGGGGGGGGVWGEEGDEDLMEDLVILLVLLGTVGLVWVRARWANRERERAEEERRRE